MARSIFGGKNSSTEIATGVNAASRVQDIQDRLNKKTLLSFPGYYDSTNLFTNTISGTGVNPALTSKGASYVNGGVLLDAGAGAGWSGFYSKQNFTNPIGSVDTSRHLVLEFDIEFVDAANGSTGTFYGFDGNVAGTFGGTTNNIIGLRQKSGALTTMQWVTDKAGTETGGSTDSAMDVSNGKSNHIKIDIQATQVDFYVNDMDTPEATHNNAASLPTICMALLMAVRSTAAVAVDAVIGNLELYELVDVA